MKTTEMDTIYNKIENTISLCDKLYENMQKGCFNFGIVLDMINELTAIGDFILSIDHENIRINDLNEKLKEGLNALEDKDYSLFSDIAQYELKPLLEYWKDIIQ